MRAGRRYLGTFTKKYKSRSEAKEASASFEAEVSSAFGQGSVSGTGAGGDSESSESTSTHAKYHATGWNAVKAPKPVGSLEDLMTSIEVRQCLHVHDRTCRQTIPVFDLLACV